MWLAPAMAPMQLQHAVVMQPGCMVQSVGFLPMGGQVQTFGPKAALTRCSPDQGILSAVVAVAPGAGHRAQSSNARSWSPPTVQCRQRPQTPRGSVVLGSYQPTMVVSPRASGSPLAIAREQQYAQALGQLPVLAGLTASAPPQTVFGAAATVSQQSRLTSRGVTSSVSSLASLSALPASLPSTPTAGARPLLVALAPPPTQLQVQPLPQQHLLQPQAKVLAVAQRFCSQPQTRRPGSLIIAHTQRGSLPARPVANQKATMTSLAELGRKPDQLVLEPQPSAILLGRGRSEYSQAQAASLKSPSSKGKEASPLAESPSASTMLEPDISGVIVEGSGRPSVFSGASESVMWPRLSLMPRDSTVSSTGGRGSITTASAAAAAASAAGRPPPPLRDPKAIVWGAPPVTPGSRRSSAESTLGQLGSMSLLGQRGDSTVREVSPERALSMLSGIRSEAGSIEVDSPEEGASELSPIVNDMSAVLSMGRASLGPDDKEGKAVDLPEGQEDEEEEEEEPEREQEVEPEKSPGSLRAARSPESARTASPNAAQVPRNMNESCVSWSCSGGDSSVGRGLDASDINSSGDLHSADWEGIGAKDGAGELAVATGTMVIRRRSAEGGLDDDDASHSLELPSPAAGGCEPSGASPSGDSHRTVSPAEAAELCGFPRVEPSSGSPAGTTPNLSSSSPQGCVQFQWDRDLGASPSTVGAISPPLCDVSSVSSACGTMALTAAAQAAMVAAVALPEPSALPPPPARPVRLRSAPPRSVGSMLSSPNTSVSSVSPSKSWLGALPLADRSPRANGEEPVLWSLSPMSCPSRGRKTVQVPTSVCSSLLTLSASSKSESEVAALPSTLEHGGPTVVTQLFAASTQGRPRLSPTTTPRPGSSTSGSGGAGRISPTGGIEFFQFAANSPRANIGTSGLGSPTWWDESYRKTCSSTQEAPRLELPARPTARIRKPVSPPDCGEAGLQEEARDAAAAAIAAAQVAHAAACKAEAAAAAADAARGPAVLPPQAQTAVDRLYSDAPSPVAGGQRAPVAGGQWCCTEGLGKWLGDARSSRTSGGASPRSQGDAGSPIRWPPVRAMAPAAATVRRVVPELSSHAAGSVKVPAASLLHGQHAARSGLRGATTRTSEAIQFN